MWGNLRSHVSALSNVNLVEGDDYTFGSSNECYCDLTCLDNNGIEAQHFTITREIVAGCVKPVYITDNSKHAGIVVNGERLMRRRQILASNDVFGVPAIPKMFTFQDLKGAYMQRDYPEKIWSKYFIENEEIGSGAFGSVAICHEVKTCAKFAVKEIKMGPFSQETVLLRRLQNYPFIVRLHHTIIRCVYKRTNTFLWIYAMNRYMNALNRATAIFWNPKPR